MNPTNDLKFLDDFSLVQGGPLFQLFVRGRLATGALGWLKRRIMFFTLFTWLPLLLLSAVSSGSSRRRWTRRPGMPKEQRRHCA